ncbi:hypothetical protein [Deinococcus aquaticus]|uniref:hypothetical protein n=1 Tax=Deinococcus aquaticus TaxID=328692 RepID=UPI003F47D4F9
MIQGDPLRGEAIHRTERGHLLTEVHAEWDRLSLAKLVAGAGPGDRVVIIAAEPTGIDWVFGPGCVYRMFTLT